jgi:hypothetical protein
MGKHINYIGTKIHKLTIIGDSGNRNNKGEKIWNAICECGNKTTIISSKISGKRKKSCGCAIKGRKFSDEGRAALSRAKIGTTGSKSNAWKGGRAIPKRRYLEYDLWRDSVLVRDDYTCQKCKKRGGKLVAHHIVSFTKNKEKRTKVDNGVTMCRECHKNFHKKYGVHFFKEQDTEQYLKV